MHQRYEGFRQALRTAALDWDMRLLEHVDTATHAAGRELGRELLTRHPDATAVFATADILAIGIVAGLGESGAQVPSDVSVVGFDDLDLCGYVTPRLTTVSQDISQKAATAVRMLVTSIEQPELAREAVTLGVHLVERDSTAPVRS